MALTITNVVVDRQNSQRETIADILFDNNYLTGGMAIGAAQLQQLDLHSTITYFEGKEKGGATTRLVSFDYTNQKIRLFTALSTEAGNGSDQSGITIRALFRADS